MIPFALISGQPQSVLPAPTPEDLLDTSLLWYDFSIATASTDTADRNTVFANGTFSVFSRVYDLGTSGKHLLRIGTLAQYRMNYLFDSSKSLYVGENTETSWGVATQSVVLKQDVSSITQFMVFKMPNSYGAFGSGVFQITGPTYSVKLGINGFDSPNYLTLGHAYITPTTNTKGIIVSTASWQLVVATMSHNLSTLSDVYMKVNGVLATQSANGGHSFGGSIDINVGAPRPTRYGEFITFESLLSSSEIATIENYLKSKWNITY